MPRLFEIARGGAVCSNPRHCPRNARRSPGSVARAARTRSRSDGRPDPDDARPDAPAVDLTAERAAGRADPSPAPQPDSHDHPLGAKADVDDRGARETQQTVQCRGDAHVVLLRKPLTFKQPAACAEGGGRVICVLRNLQTNPTRRTARSRGPSHADVTTNPREDPHHRGDDRRRVGGTHGNRSARRASRRGTGKPGILGLRSFEWPVRRGGLCYAAARVVADSAHARVVPRVTG